MALLPGAMMYGWALGTTAENPGRDLPRRVAQAFWASQGHGSKILHR